MGAVLRLLHGEALDALSRELGVGASTLAGWKEAFLTAGQAGLNSREPVPRGEENARLKQLLSDREMRLEIHRQATKLRGYELPFELGKRKKIARRRPLIVELAKAPFSAGAWISWWLASRTGDPSGS